MLAEQQVVLKKPIILYHGSLFSWQKIPIPPVTVGSLHVACQDRDLKTDRVGQREKTWRGNPHLLEEIRRERIDTQFLFLSGKIEIRPYQDRYAMNHPSLLSLGHARQMHGERLQRIL